MLYLIIKAAVSGVIVALGRAQSASLEPGASNGESLTVPGAAREKSLSVHRPRATRLRT